MIQGRIHSIETFGSVDGPGTRFIIFVQGCNMRCLYCHNVDTWKCGQGGQLKTADELLDQAERYRPYWGPEGGITVSGGEPLLQMDFLLDLFRKAKARGIGTCIDTAGQPFTRKEPFFSQFQELMEVTKSLPASPTTTSWTCSGICRKSKSPSGSGRCWCLDGPTIQGLCSGPGNSWTPAATSSGWKCCPTTTWACTNGNSWGSPTS